VPWAWAGAPFTRRPSRQPADLVSAAKALDAAGFGKRRVPPLRLTHPPGSESPKGTGLVMDVLRSEDLTDRRLGWAGESLVLPVRSVMGVDPADAPGSTAMGSRRLGVQRDVERRQTSPRVRALQGPL